MINDLTVPTTDRERQEWADNITDTVGKYSESQTWNYARYDYEENFRRFCGDLDPDDFKYITQPFGKPKPMHFANYPLIEPLVQRLIGEYTSRPVPFNILRINKNAYSTKMNLMGRLAAEQILAPIWKEAEKMIGMKLPIEKKMELIPEQFKSAPHKSIRDALEINLKYGLNYLYHRYEFAGEFSKCLYDVLINNDVCAKIDIVNNDPVISHRPIQNMIFQRGEGNYIFDKIHRRSPFMGTDLWKPLSEILHLYGYRLKKDQREKLIKDQQTLIKNPSYIEEWNKNGYCVREYQGSYYYRVIDIEVKAHSEKQFLSIPYEPNNEKVYSNRSIDEIWELCKISNDIYLRPLRRRNQIPYQGNHMDLQFSYFGMLSRHSFITKTFPVQLLYSNCMMTLDFLLAQAGGKAIRYGTERKPDGYELEDVAFSAHTLGLVIEQIRAGDIPGRSTASGEVDFGPSASMQYIIALATMLTQTAERMTGMPSARSGQAASTSPVGTVQSNLIQSSFMTKPIFDVIDKFTETGFQRCADLIRYMWVPGETKAYHSGDGIQHVFKVSQDFELAEAGIYVQSSVKQAQEKEYIMGWMEKTLATDATMILELVKAFNAESGAEVEQVLELGISVIRQNAEKINQQKLQIGQQANEIAQRANDLKAEELDIKRTVPVTVAKTQKASAENVALINKEKELNKSSDSRIAQNDQMLYDMAQQDKEMEHEKQMQQQTARQPAVAQA